MKTNTAEITAPEQRELENLPFSVERLLVKKGFKSKGLLAPIFLGKIHYWEDRVTGSFHYTQEIENV